MAASRRIPALTIPTRREQALAIGRPIQGVHAIGLTMIGKDGCARLATLLSSRGSARHGGEAAAEKQKGEQSQESEGNVPLSSFGSRTLMSRSGGCGLFVFLHGE